MLADQFAEFGAYAMGAFTLVCVCTALAFARA